MAEEGFLGGNVDQMKDLKKRFDANKAQLEGIRGRIESKGRSVNWTGPDATKFKGQDLGDIKRFLTNAANHLGSGSKALHDNIVEQETISNQS